MATITISPLNPIKYYQEGFTSEYQSKHLDDYPFEETILPWEESVTYAQPWQKGDPIHQQLIAPYDTVTIEVYDHDGTVHLSENFTQKLYNLDDPTQKLFEHTLDLSTLAEEHYRFRLKFFTTGVSGAQVTLISNTQYVRTQHPNSVLLQYKNYQFKEDVIFETGFHPSLRILGTLKFDAPGSKRTVYEDQILNTTSLDAKRFRTWKLYCGSEVGIPDYLIDKLEAILGCSDVSIDGRYYAAPEGAKMEPVEEDGYPMRGWSIELRETRQLSGVFSVVLPEVDTTAPNVIDAYVTDEERAKIVLVLSEPLGGYRIPDSELYLNLSHYSVWANVSGSEIHIFTNMEYEYGDIITVTYSGGSIVDKAGNQMAYTEDIPVRNLINNPAATQFTAEWVYTASDPYTPLYNGIDGFAWSSGVFPVGADVRADFHEMPPEYYAVMREPDTETAKTKWSDSGATYNNGVIPDSVFRTPFVQGGKRYYITRVKMTFDNKIDSRVVFSK